MTSLALLWVYLTTATAFPGTWAPHDAMLTAVRHIESADGLRVVGDNGRSLGEFQISEAAWLDVNSWRQNRGLPTFEYQKGVWNSRITRAYAAQYLTILHGKLAKRLGRAPTSAEVYSAYNMGLTAFSRNQYRLSKAALTLCLKDR